MTQEATQQARTALITGGTGGIGKALAGRLARDGFQVTIVGRNAERGAAAQRDIQAAVPAARVDFIQADLSLMREVKRLAEAVRARHEHLDLLVHSAGAIHTRRILTEEGMEATFTTDYLSRFYLTELLMDHLRASGGGRVLNIAAAGSGMGRLHFDDLHGERKISGMRGLGQAQFANDVHTLELARRLNGAAVTVNAMHPGMVDTGIRREFPGWLNRLLGFLFARWVMTPEEGAAAPYALLTSPEYEDVSGGLFQREKPLSPSEKTADPALGRRLWESSQRLVAEALEAGHDS
jgi:NAD(P)-dependent dehydrogenase (short-subunit alcohol dehydrogenase family)